MIRRLAITGMMMLCSVLLVYSVSAQGGATQVGLTSAGRNAVEVIGQIDQTGFETVFGGYITYISGLPEEALFTKETIALDRGEAGALFTFHGKATVNTRSVLENLTTTTAKGTIDFYYSDKPVGGSFKKLDSFVGKVKIASFSGRFKSLINVQQPNVGVFSMFGELEQSSPSAFTIDGKSYQLGREKLLGSLELNGQGNRSSINPLAAKYVFVGTIIQPAGGQQN